MMFPCKRGQNIIFWTLMDILLLLAQDIVAWVSNSMGERNVYRIFKEKPMEQGKGRGNKIILKLT
jgi:hypothetical protein